MCRSNTFKLNCLLVFHKSYTYGLAALVRGMMLWFGGVALFADLTTVGKCQRWEEQLKPADLTSLRP